MAVDEKKERERGSNIIFPIILKQSGRILNGDREEGTKFVLEKLYTPLVYCLIKLF